ncbi:hypothetical protein JXA34_02750 [Patescibacteria group bacterium]|nr:hypothetical protein [Patescibacteria group bacterium]
MSDIRKTIKSLIAVFGISFALLITILLQKEQIKISGTENEIVDKSVSIPTNYEECLLDIKYKLPNLTSTVSCGIEVPIETMDEDACRRNGGTVKISSVSYSPDDHDRIICNINFQNDKNILKGFPKDFDECMVSPYVFVLELKDRYDKEECSIRIYEDDHNFQECLDRGGEKMIHCQGYHGKEAYCIGGEWYCSYTYNR